MAGARESSFLERIKSLLNEERRADVIFEIRATEKLYGHKLILEGASPVFEEMFRASQEITVISISDFGRESVMNILRFVHLHDVNINENDLQTVLETLKLARKYKLKDGLQLENACKERLIVEVSVDNVCDLLQNAMEDSNGGDLAEKCWSVVDREAPRVFKTANFKNLALSVLEQMLGRDSLLCTEIQVFDAAIAWAKEKCRTGGLDQNPKQLRVQLGIAFFKIRFPLMTVVEFESGPEKVIHFTDCETKILYKYYLNRELKRIDQSDPPSPFSCTPRVELVVRKESGADRTKPSIATPTLTPIKAMSSSVSQSASPNTRSTKKRKEVTLSSSNPEKTKRTRKTSGRVSPVPVRMPAPKWFSETFPQRSPYFPQIGDEVVYYRQGHKCYADAVQKKRVYPVSESMKKEFPYVRFPDLPAIVVARVQKIEFVLEPYPLICVKLEELDLPGRQFEVRYHDMDDEVDFLILRQVHDKRCAEDWAIRDKFRVMIGKDWVCGEVNAKVPINQSFRFKHSKFMCYQVTFTNGTKQSLSPWDMERIPELFENRERIEEGYVTATEDELRAHAHYIPTEADWKPYARDTLCKTLRKLFPTVKQLPSATHFRVPVDLEEHPEYSLLVAYPMDLSLIQRRLTNLFYRRIDALKFDLEFLVTNAERFKPEDAEYIRNAKITRDVCLKLIENPDTQSDHVMKLHNDLGGAAIHSSPEAGPSMIIKRTSSCSSVSSMPCLSEIFSPN